MLSFILKNLRAIVDSLNGNISHLPPTISEIIFENLDINNFGIAEEDLRYFKSKKLCLHKIVLNGHRIKYKNSLNFLENHPLKCLKIYCLNTVRIIEWIKFLKQDYLEEFCIADDNFINSKIDFLSGINTLTCYKTLRIVNFSNTNFDEECLELLCNNFQEIIELKLINTRIKSLNGINSLKNLQIFHFVDRKKIINFRELKHISSLENLIEFHAFFESSLAGGSVDHRWVKRWLDEINWIHLKLFVFSFCEYFQESYVRFVKKINTYFLP